MTTKNPGPVIDQTPPQPPRATVDQRWNDSAFKTPLEPTLFVKDAGVVTDAYDYPGKTGLK